jgi:hypothetical protein
MSACIYFPGLDNLSLVSRGATCLVGTYNVTYDTNCGPTIDGTLSSYIPRPGNGWLTISLPSAAMVTAVDILFDWDLVYDTNIRLRIIFSDHDETLVNIIYASLWLKKKHNKIMYI